MSLMQSGGASWRNGALSARIRRFASCLLANIPATVVVFSLVLLGIGAYATTRGLERERALAVREAEGNAANLARAYEEHIFQIVRRLDQALVHLRDEFERDPASFLARAESWKTSLYADLAFQVGAIGPDGTLLFSNLKTPPQRLDLSDREHFRVHRQGGEDTLFISRPVLGRVSGKWTIQFTRRMRAADGSFGGVLVLSVDPAILSGFLKPADVGREGVVALVGQDRIIRARASAVAPPSDPIGTTLPDRPFFDPAAPDAGVFWLASALDGVPRITAYRRVRDYPLVVHILLGEREAMAGYVARRDEVVGRGSIVAALVLGATLVIAWLARRQRRHQRRLEETQRRLAEAEERWRLALAAVGDGIWDWDLVTDEVFFSHDWKSMLGYADDEIANRLREWESRVHPDDLAAVREALNRHFAGETPFYANEHRVRCKDGGYKWILDRGVVVARRADGTPLRMVGTHTDISPGKAAQDTLRAMAARLEAILESAPVGVAIVDPDRRILVANDAMARIVQRDSADLQGVTTRLLYEDEERFAEVGRRLYPIIERGGTIGEELQMRRGDGTSFWARIVGHRVSMDDPALGTVWVVDDISARKQAERALEQNHRFQRVLTDTIPIPIFVRDRLGHYIDANAAFERWMGIARGTLFGLTVHDIAPPDLAAVYEEADRALLASPGTQLYEGRVRRTDGTELDVEFCTAVYYDSAGAPAGVVGAIVDISERKKAEQALRERQELFEQIFAASLAVKLLIDPADGRIVDANPAAEAFYGHSLDALRAMRIDDINVLSADEVRREMEHARHDARQYFVFRHRLASGEVRDVEVYCSPINVNGRELLLSLVHDITQRRRAEEALQQQAAELERSNAELEAFAYVASHDLRQPLRTINSYLGLLERDLAGGLDDDTREYMAFCRDGAQRMDRLIVDLLEYSRVGRKAKPFTSWPAGDLVRTALDNLELSIAEASATVTVAPDLPTLWGDGDELIRLFQNLIGNAVKYRAPGRAPVVEVAGTREGRTWHVTVRDNGIGIAPEHRERVFGIFQRLHRRDEYEGTGIGLAVCKKIVEHHGGRIWVESEPGLGSTFHVTFPRREAQAA